MRVRITGLIALVVYGLGVFGANWFNRHVGPVVIPGGTHLVSVGFGLLTPSGVYAAGVTFVARDVVQRTIGRHWSLVIVPLGAALSAFLDPHLALASGLAFFASESTDFLVYTAIQRYFVRAVFLSGTLASVVDSLVFLSLIGALIPGVFLGQLLGKVYVLLLAVPVALLLRKTLLPNAVPQRRPARQAARPR